MGDDNAKPVTLQAVFDATLAHHREGRLEAAEAGYRRLLRHAPDHHPSLYNLGLLLRRTGRAEAAIETWRRAVASHPDQAHIHKAIGRSLLGLGRFSEAITAFDTALAITPDDVDALNCRGNAERFLGRTAGSLPYYDRALALAPDYAFAHVNRGHALSVLGDVPGAIAAFDRGLQLDEAGNLEALGARFADQLRICDWRDYETSRRSLPDRLAAGQAVDQPFNLLVYSDDPDRQLAAARAYGATRAAYNGAPLWAGESYRHERLRIGYVSSDFRSHAVAHLIGALFEHHDTGRFDVHAFALAPAADDAVRQRIAAATPNFHDVAQLTEAEIAARIRAAEIDIVVDLNGYTTYCQPGIFARRCAPVQVNFLGYPGTMGAPFMDYILADQVTIPPGAEAGFSEKVVRLPGAYQPNDPRVEVGPTPSRQDAGLPPSGVVFCCFNANFKIAPPVFDAWMRILGQVPDSVLWLLETSSAAKANLRAEAAHRGVDPDRLIFAPKAPIADHLARHRLADLFLDTAPYNAHTTASDALRMGLPVVTCAGRTFASRVAASLLTVVGQPELVTTSMSDYEALAVSLASSPARLAALRIDLANKAPASRLFDIGQFARDLEDAFIRMAAQAGLPPAGFDLA